MASLRTGLRVLAVLVVSLLLGVSSVLFGTCGPFTDVAGDAFCPFVLEVFYLGVTTGTTPTTYDPTSPVSRLQMAAFLSRTVDRTLLKSSRRAAAQKFWVPQNALVQGTTTVGAGPRGIQFDGADLWVGNASGSTVSRVRASDGRLLETWTGAGNAYGVLLAMGRVLVAGSLSPGRLYSIDPRQPAGAVTTVANTLGNQSSGIAFDGVRVWTTNQEGSVSIVTPQVGPWTVTTVNVTAGSSAPFGILYDGGNIWVTDLLANTLLKLSATGTVLQTVTVGSFPAYPVFDGTNIWVPHFAADGPVTVVRASNGAILQTLTGNGLSFSFGAAFDGERVLIANGGESVSLWKAADLTPLGSFPLGTSVFPNLATSDGTNFWITLNSAGQIVRF